MAREPRRCSIGDWSVVRNERADRANVLDSMVVMCVVLDGRYSFVELQLQLTQDCSNDDGTNEHLGTAASKLLRLLLQISAPPGKLLVKQPGSLQAPHSEAIGTAHSKKFASSMTPEITARGRLDRGYASGAFPTTLSAAPEVGKKKHPVRSPANHTNVQDYRPLSV